MEIKPISNVGNEGMIELQKTPSGMILCPAGYPLRKIAEGTWRCEGGNHQYSMDEQTMMLDKFGHYWVKSSNEADLAEKRGKK